MRVILLMAAISGCAGNSDGAAARQVCVPGKPSVDAAVYSALTATGWFDAGGCGPTGDPLPPTCNRLQLGSDGSYTWTAFSDYPERMQAGSWNFRARDATSGMVCLDDGSVVDFALTPTGDLRWGQLGLLSAETPSRLGALPVKSSPSPRRGGRAGLPVITVDPLFVDLTAHGWAKTNEMDLYSEPTSFALHNDGTLDAKFRDGECTVSGTFSLIREQVSTGTSFMLWSSPGPNVCDTRNGGTPASVIGGVPRLEDGMLVAGRDSYRDVAIDTGERYLAFSSYSSEAGLTVSAQWDGALRGNAQTSWAISLRNDGKDPQVPASLRLDVTPAVMTSNGLMATGPAVTVVDRPLGSTIPPGDSFPLQDDVTFTPGPVGWALIHVEIRSSDSRQAYDNQGYFIVELP